VVRDRTPSAPGRHTAAPPLALSLLRNLCRQGGSGESGPRHTVCHHPVVHSTRAGPGLSPQGLGVPRRDSWVRWPRDSPMTDFHPHCCYISPEGFTCEREATWRIDRAPRRAGLRIVVCDEHAARLTTEGARLERIGALRAGRPFAGRLSGEAPMSRHMIERRGSEAPGGPESLS
jgi:hypothetical protein